MRSLERVNIRTNVRTYVHTHIRTGQTLYPLHNFVVRGDNHLPWVGGRDRKIYSEGHGLLRVMVC